MGVLVGALREKGNQMLLQKEGQLSWKFDNCFKNVKTLFPCARPSTSLLRLNII